MKTLLTGSNQLTLEDGYDYDLVIPDDIDYLAMDCTTSIPDKIRNVIVPNPQTQGDGSEYSYAFRNLTTTNVVYSGSDTKAPWGAKSLNGVDATYIPKIMGGFDNQEIAISDDQSSTPVEFKLVLDTVYPTILQEKLNSCLLDSITAQLNNTDVTSEVLNCIEFSSQPVYDETWQRYCYTFTTKPGSELSVLLNGEMLNITAILKDPTDASKTYTWDNIMLELTQTAADINIRYDVNITEVEPYASYNMTIPEVNRKYIKKLAIRGLRINIASLGIIDLTSGEFMYPTSLANNIATFDNIDLYTTGVQSRTFEISMQGVSTGAGSVLTVYECTVGNSID